MSRRIFVVKTWVIRSGEGTKGPWTLRGVEANDASGNPIPEQLKTFVEIGHGEVEVEVEAQHHEQYGTSYLLKPVGRRSGGGNGGNGGQAPAGELAELRDRIARLESEVRRLSAAVDRREPVAPPAGAVPDEEDIPF